MLSELFLKNCRLSTLSVVMFSTILIAIGCKKQAINHPPVANAGADKTVILPSNVVNLDASGSTDEDNDIRFYLWKWIAGPSSLNFLNGDGGSIFPRLVGLVEGTYEFELTVTDAAGLFSKDTVAVFVTLPSGVAHVVDLTFDLNSSCTIGDDIEGYYWFDQQIFTLSATATKDFDGHPGEIHAQIMQARNFHEPTHVENPTLQVWDMMYENLIELSFKKSHNFFNIPAQATPYTDTVTVESGIGKFAAIAKSTLLNCSYTYDLATKKGAIWLQGTLYY